jgi:HAE1 family hydrophobic/amphiphilic exporter-1
MNLVAACVANPVKVAVGVILVTLFGVLALLSMPVQLTPEVQTPTISVGARWVGASPQEIERELVQPLEEQLRSVEGLVKLSSDSSDSLGTIELEFAVGTDMSQALVKVNTRVQQVRDWPIDADRPVIRTASPWPGWFWARPLPTPRKSSLPRRPTLPLPPTSTG